MGSENPHNVLSVVIATEATNMEGTQYRETGEAVIRHIDGNAYSVKTAEGPWEVFRVPEIKLTKATEDETRIRRDILKESRNGNVPWKVSIG